MSSIILNLIHKMSCFFLGKNDFERGQSISEVETQKFDILQKYLTIKTIIAIPIAKFNCLYKTA